MLKLILFTIILSGFTPHFYSQTKVFPKDVETRIGENRKSNQSRYKGISVVFSFTNRGVSSLEAAKQFDTWVIEKNSRSIKSCETAQTSSGFNSVIIAKGHISADNIKEIVLENHGTIIEWKAIYMLNENVILPEVDNRHVISGKEYDVMPQEKRKHIQENQEKYQIVYK